MVIATPAFSGILITCIGCAQCGMSCVLGNPGPFVLTHSRSFTLGNSMCSIPIADSIH